MPITVAMMEAASASGLSAVCASCERYWEARERGVPGDRCAATRPCGSPLAGDYFNDYRGILTSDAFKRFCFVCANPAHHILRNPAWYRDIGVCSEHLSWMDDAVMRSPSREKLKSLNGFKMPPRGTLLGEILHTEKEWAEQDGREFDLEEILGPSRKRDAGD